MAEYIYKSNALNVIAKLINENKRQYDTSFHRGKRAALKEALEEIEKIKGTDEKPVKRGRWIETHISLCKWVPEDEKEKGHNFYMAELKCSCCERYNTVTFSLSLTKPNFCQLCGAKMDKTRNLTDEETDIYNSQLEAEAETIEKVQLFSEKKLENNKRK